MFLNCVSVTALNLCTVSFKLLGPLCLTEFMTELKVLGEVL